MENSTILRELADFDINAPISVSICFEDDSDETPIKTEIETDDSLKNQETTNSAFVPILEPKTKIEADTFAPSITQKNTSEFTAHNNFQDSAALQAESLQHQLSTSDETLRKRKSVVIQMCKPKKSKIISDTAGDNNGKGEISPESFASHDKEDYIQTIPCPTTTENTKKTIDNQTDLNLNGSGLQQTDIGKVKEFVVNCLAAVSENMRRIMQAYGVRKQQQMSIEDFIQVKLQHFKLSYKTIVTIFLPEENNNAFMDTFLNDTLQRARSKSGSYFIHTYQNYANLLHEMIIWSKNQKQPTQKIIENAKQPVHKSVITEHQVPAQKKTPQNNIQFSNSNTERDRVCLFSSGPPERALTINIDTRLNKKMKTTTKSHSTKTNQLLHGALDNGGDMSQGKSTAEYLSQLVGNNNKPAHQSVIQPTSSQIPNPVTNHQQYPMPQTTSPSYSMKTMSNYTITSQQMRDTTPVLRMQLGKAPLQSHLAQPVESQRPLFGHTRHYAPQTQRPMPPPYSQSHHLKGQSGPQQQFSPQCCQVPVLETQQHSTPIQFQQSQYLQAQSVPQYVQPQQLQCQLGRSHLPVPEYNQTIPQVGLTQPGPQQPHPHATEHWPSLVELLATESTPPPPYTNVQVQSALSGQWQSRNQQPQLKPYRTEWQQGLNNTFQVGQVPQPTQKGSPRSASTDSGFISPLNFNVSMDQTMPTMPQEPESTMPMIVHVTSLSDKASYVELGKCEVCKKITKQMCMGCMKIYYCNYECQSVDWAAHAPNCMQQSTTN